MKNGQPLTTRFLHYLIEIETSLESVNTSAGVYKLLLTGIERMASGADFHLNVLLGRLCFNDIATVAGDRRLIQYGMDILFHAIHLIFCNLCSQTSSQMRHPDTVYVRHYSVAHQFL